MSHAFWMRYLESDPKAIGSTILLSGDTYTIVGIAGPELDMRELGAPEVWTPLAVDPGTTTQAYLYRVVARLKPGVTLKQAQAELAASTAVFRERFPGVLGPRAGFGAVWLADAFVRSDTRATLLVLAGAVGFVLLIACADVANLLLVRGTRRRGEIGIRRTLGADSRRIVQPLLIEGLLLSIAGGALGLVVGFLGIRALLSIDTASLPRLGDAGALLGLDWRVVAFALAISLATTVAFSFAPAFVARSSAARSPRLRRRAGYAFCHLSAGRRGTCGSSEQYYGRRIGRVRPRRSVLTAAHARAAHARQVERSNPVNCSSALTSSR